MPRSPRPVVPLTDEQAQFVEKNHNLIYTFLYQRKLSIEEYYGVAALGLCRAVVGFDPNKGAFSTYAYACMLGYVRNAQKAWARCPPTVSLEDAEEDRLSPLERVPDPGASVESELLAAELWGSLTAGQQCLARCRAAGLTQTQIGAKLGVEQTTVSRHLKRLREALS